MEYLIFILIFGVGFWVGRETAPKPKHVKKPVRRALSFNERQRRKITYSSESDRIRELNLLSANDSIFFRLLKQEFLEREIVVKRKRFFVVDSDKYPIAIFEYRNGTEQLKNSSIEDGLPVFLYKAILSSEAIREDKQRIAEMFKS
ncbi:hypothetical protein [Acinetobacter gyllenbergii]|uniref:hypothetical protein n=1 Tax=Acinetobacter gyllenbergii TaxID=134534 RepID=UPI003F56B537